MRPGNSLSPNGAVIAVSMRAARSSEIWMKSVDHRPASRLALNGPYNVAPSWTPDGRSLSVGFDPANTNVWFIRTVSADGHATDARTASFQVRLGIDTAPVPLVVTKADESNPIVSPNGRWLAFSSNITGRHEIHVRPFPNTADASWVVSNGGGTEPLWSRDGRELFYRSAQRRMVAAAVTSQPTFGVDSLRDLFGESDFKGSMLRPQYDVTPDGQRFLMIRQHPRQKTGQVVLVLNFLQDAALAR